MRRGRSSVLDHQPVAEADDSVGGRDTTGSWLASSTPVPAAAQTSRSVVRTCVEGSWSSRPVGSSATSAATYPPDGGGRECPFGWRDRTDAARDCARIHLIRAR
jgi:hypothetical protein